MGVGRGPVIRPVVAGTALGAAAPRCLRWKSLPRCLSQKVSRGRATRDHGHRPPRGGAPILLPRRTRHWPLGMPRLPCPSRAADRSQPSTARRPPGRAAGSHRATARRWSGTSSPLSRQRGSARNRKGLGLQACGRKWHLPARVLTSGAALSLRPPRQGLGLVAAPWAL